MTEFEGLPGISVVMPAHNAERFIEQAIDSILQQTYPHFELVVVDDGSTDATAAIVERYASQDSRVKLVRQARSGVSQAGNTGLHAARWDWVARMDADDIAMPRRLETLIRAAVQQPEVIVWGSHAYQINVNNRVIGTVEHGPASDADYQAMRASGEPFFILNPTTLFRRDIALQVGGYDATFVAAGDEELWSRMAPHGMMRVLTEKLLRYRIHSGSVTASHLAYQQQVHRFIQARNLAWQAGDDLTFADFQAQQRSQPLLRRLSLWLKARGAYHYRQAGLLLSVERRWAALGQLGLALLFHPRFTLARTWGRLMRQRRLEPPPSPDQPSRKM